MCLLRIFDVLVHSGTIWLFQTLSTLLNSNSTVAMHALAYFRGDDWMHSGTRVSEDPRPGHATWAVSSYLLQHMLLHACVSKRRADVDAIITSYSLATELLEVRTTWD